MSGSQDLADAIMYTWAWLHRDRAPPKSTQYINTLRGRYHRFDHGHRLSMQKGTMKTRIKFELESREEVYQIEQYIRGLNGIYSETEDRALCLTFYDGDTVPDQDYRLRTVYNILKNTKVAWQVVGPRCPGFGVSHHDHSNINMIVASRQLLSSTREWVCTQAGCRGRIPVNSSDFMTYHDFHDSVNAANKRGELKTISGVVEEIGKKGKFAESYNMGVDRFVQLLVRDLKDLFPDTARQAAKNVSSSRGMYRSPYVQGSASDVTTKMSEEMKQRLADSPLTLQVHDGLLLPDTAAMQKQINQLTAKGDELANKLEANTKQYEEEYEKWADVRQKLEQELQNLKRLPKASDAMFRFLAGINMQDHSTSEQKEFLRLMRELKEALQDAGIGSQD